MMEAMAMDEAQNEDMGMDMAMSEQFSVFGKINSAAKAP